MRTFPAAFTTELAKKTGITPIWVLRMVINGVTYDLSDSVFVFPVGMANGFTSTLPWIGQWGEVRESISGAIGEMLVSDFSCTLLVDQDVTDNIRHLALNHALEQSPVELYLWLDELTSATPPQKLFVGYVKDVDIPDETQVNITIEDESVRFQKYIGTRISSEVYPLCDPDDVGKLIPIVYGTVSKLPALCVDSGWVSSLPQGLSKLGTSMVVSEIPSYSLINKYAWVEEEIVLISAQTGKTLTVIHAQSGTTAADHIKGMVVIERKQTPLVYMLADHSVDAIGTVLARIRGVNVDITSDVKTYLGTAGNQLSAYPGKAAFTIADYARVSQKISLALTGAVNASNGSHSHAAGTVSVTNAAPWSWTQSPSNQVLTASYNMRGIPGTGVWSYYNAVLTVNFPSPPANILTRTISVTINCTIAAGPITLFLTGIGVIGTYTPGSGAQTFSFAYNPSYLSAAIYGGAIVQLQVPCFKMLLGVGVMYNNDYISTYYVTIVTATDVGTYNTTSASNVNISAANTPITVTNTLQLTGNSVADIYLGDMVLADVTRNITTPQAVISNLLSTYCNDATLTTIGTMPSGYAFNGAITEYKKAIEWLDYLSFQCRSYFRKIAGVSKLIVRDVNPTSQVTISSCCLTSEGIKDISIKKAALSDVINKVKVFYTRDWTKTTRQYDAFDASTSPVTDAVSITNYGEQENPQMFLFDFVTNSVMANDLAAFYCDFYGDRKWRITLSTFLDQAALQFGDIATLSNLPYVGDVITQIVEAGIVPGDLSRMDQMKFVFEVAIIPALDATALTTLLGDQLITKDTREGIIYV